MTMAEFDIHEAKTHLARLLKRVAAGEEVVITKAGRPIARIVPYSPPRLKRTPGRLRGQIKLAEDFDGPLSDDLLESSEQ